jgi:hypothetical protein
VTILLKPLHCVAACDKDHHRLRFSIVENKGPRNPYRMKLMLYSSPFH